MNELPLILSIFSLVIAALCLIALVPVYGKIFYSTHVREFVPIDEYAGLTKGVQKKHGVNRAAPVADQPDADEDEEIMDPAERERLKLAALSNAFWSGQDEGLQPLVNLQSLWKDPNGVDRGTT